MNCPNCFKEMKEKREMRERISLGHWDCDYYDGYIYIKCKCKKCNISCEGEEGKEMKWNIPERYAPTERQIKTILFINNRLRLGLEPLTKKQCWQDINKYFNKAKETPRFTDEEWLDIQEEWGMDFADFC